MKIGTPELKVKPATKYFDGGYISFKTVNKELSYKITGITKTRQFSICSDKVKDFQQLKDLLAIKNVKQAIEVIGQ